jgi:regulator of protease activity HflC (stomatin/prohibitin superfamily)
MISFFYHFFVRGAGAMSTSTAPTESEVVGHQGARVDIAQRPAVFAVSGWFGVLACAGCIAWLLIGAHGVVWLPVAILVLVASGLDIVPPGRTSVVQFFGHYIGTVTRPGFWWVAPLTVRRRVSLRVRNFETHQLKVNDADGSPVEIAAIVVWQVADTAKAVYAVDDYFDFVSVQAESALRHVATSHPYDDPTGAGTSLRGSTDQVVADLARELAQRVQIAGVEIVEVRISHLAYAQEIAQAMLRRQQASAVVAARQRIVDGAVGMVESALARLSADGIIELDDERRAAMVSNMLVVLCSDHATQPVVNTGTLYQ